MKSSDEEGADHFPLRFKEYRDRELNYSRLRKPAESPPKLHPDGNLFDNDGVRWVFWNRQDDNPYRTLPNDHPKVRLNIRYALQKFIMCLELRQCLVQFWAPTKTAEGRTLLTTQFQPFAIGATQITSSRHRLCEYRMGMCREYDSSYADAESREEQLGLPGRVFLNQLPESTPAVEYYSLKEYPQRDLALRCGIKGSWAVPVFEHSGHTCVGVLEIVCEHNGSQGWYDEEFLGSMYYIFQELGLRCFDGYKHYKMQYGDENKARTAVFQELKMAYELVCKIHNLPLALTWVSCRSCNDLLQSQLQFLVLDYYDKVNWDEDFYKNLAVFIKAIKVCHLRKGQVTGRILPFCNLLYCSDVKQFSIAEFPLVPYARFCSFGGRFTMCLHSSDTGDELYVLEFFLPASNKNKENILTRLSLILGTMEEYFKTFKLASGQGLGEVLSVEVIDFQNGQKRYSFERIQATSIPGLELLQYGGVMLQQGQQDHPSMDAINNGMYVASEAQKYNLPSLDSLQNGKVMTQLDSSNQQSMDPSNNGQNVVTAERNILGKRKMEDREHKKAGVRIEIPIEEILKCSNMNCKDAAAAINVGISTFKRVCREYGIQRWPPRYIKQNGKVTTQLDSSDQRSIYNLPSLDSLQNGKVMTQLDSSNQRSMDPSNNGQNVVTTERNILGKRKMEDREHKKIGVRIEIPIEEILKCSNMNRKDAAAAVNVGISTFKRVCREYGIQRWPPRYVKQNGKVTTQLDSSDQRSISNLPSLDSLQNGKVMTQLDSSDQLSMDPSNSGPSVVTAERNILMVSSSKGGNKKMQDREHKKVGVRIEVSLEEILKYSNMDRNSAARELNVGISTFKRVCREHGILRWPPRYVKQVQPFPALAC